MSDCTQCADYEWCAKNEECGMFKPKTMTHADEIRTMSIEELAGFMSVGCDACMVPQYVENCPHMADGINCLDCWLDWLKQEKANSP